MISRFRTLASISFHFCRNFTMCKTPHKQLKWHRNATRESENLSAFRFCTYSSTQTVPHFYSVTWTAYRNLLLASLTIYPYRDAKLGREKKLGASKQKPKLASCQCEQMEKDVWLMQNAGKLFQTTVCDCSAPRTKVILQRVIIDLLSNRIITNFHIVRRIAYWIANMLAYESVAGNLIGLWLEHEHTYLALHRSTYMLLWCMRSNNARRLWQLTIEQ